MIAAWQQTYIAAAAAAAAAALCANAGAALRGIASLPAAYQKQALLKAAWLSAEKRETSSANGGGRL